LTEQSKSYKSHKLNNLIHKNNQTDMFSEGSVEYFSFSNSIESNNKSNKLKSNTYNLDHNTIDKSNLLK